MKKLYSYLIIAFLTLTLTGCNFGNSLYYSGQDYLNIRQDSLNLNTGKYLLYGKENKNENIYFTFQKSTIGNCLFVVVKYHNKNIYDVLFDIENIKITTKDGYILKKIPLSFYINEIENQKKEIINKQYIALNNYEKNKPLKSYKITNNYSQNSSVTTLQEDTSYLQANSKHQQEINSLIEQSNRSLKYYDSIIISLLNHSFTGVKEVPSKSWDYFYLIYELPPTYPIEVKYKDLFFEFDIKKPQQVFQTQPLMEC